MDEPLKSDETLSRGYDIPLPRILRVFHSPPPRDAVWNPIHLPEQRVLLLRIHFIQVLHEGPLNLPGDPILLALFRIFVLLRELRHHLPTIPDETRVPVLQEQRPAHSECQSMRPVIRPSLTKIFGARRSQFQRVARVNLSSLGAM